VRQIFGLAQLNHAGDPFERMEMAEQFVEHGPVDIGPTD
jgi:hypothetical protein